MGTSGSSSGPGGGTPLVPSWLGGGRAPADGTDAGSGGGDGAAPDAGSPMRAKGEVRRVTSLGQPPAPRHPHNPYQLQRLPSASRRVGHP